MPTLSWYLRNRYNEKALGFGRPWVRWLWLDAALYAVRRWSTYHSPWFRAWCCEVDRLFREQYEWPRDYTDDTERDCWIDAYWDKMSPQGAVDSEVSYWDG